MKKILRLVFTFLLMFFLAGCSGQQESETDMAPGAIVTAIRQSQQEFPELMQLTSEDTDFTTWLSDYYFLQAEQVSDGAICYADGVEASEIAVLLLNDEKDCKAVVETLNEYIQNRACTFDGYAPQQAAMVREGIIVENSRYIALLICPEPQVAKEAFWNCLAKVQRTAGIIRRMKRIKRISKMMLHQHLLWKQKNWQELLEWKILITPKRFCKPIGQGRNLFY